MNNDKLISVIRSAIALLNDMSWTNGAMLTIPELAKLETLAKELEDSQHTMTRGLADSLFPEHDRTSCDDNNLCNSYPHYDDGSSRCRRCMALYGVGEPLSKFTIESSHGICIAPNPVEVRKRALEKLTNEEKRALGL